MRIQLFVYLFIFLISANPVFAAQENENKDTGQKNEKSEEKKVNGEENQGATDAAKQPLKTREELMREAAKDYGEIEKLRRELTNTLAHEEDMDMRYNITPEQVKEARKKQLNLEDAAQIPVPASGSTRSHVVSLEPGAKVSIIRTYPQYVTTIRVLDAAGKPWPISAHMVGNSKSFMVQKPDLEPHNTLMISPVNNAGNTNLTIMLDNNEGMDTVPPLTLQLITNPKNMNNFDAVSTLRINRRGPRTSPVLESMGGPFFADEILTAVLDGVPPKHAIRMKTSDKTVEVWKINESYYVRTSSRVVWPAWTKSTTSGEKEGGIFAYELPPVESIMFSGNKSVTIDQYAPAIHRALQ